MLLTLMLAVQPAPKLYPPDAVTAARIADLRAELGRLLPGLPAGAFADVAVYAKAAEWTVRQGEWFQKDSAAATVRVLTAGIDRAKAAAGGKTPWRDVVGRPVVRGFVSAVDGSVQPVAVTRPAGDTAGLKWQCDVVLHGRDNTLTEVKFLDAKERAKPSPTTRIVIEPFGRGNNAYRWAGETDVFEAMAVVNPDPARTVLRGFSMGGAGTWHLGLHHPFRFAAMQPGAGFTTTRGYTKLPENLPPHVEATLTIYDAVRVAENATTIPVVAYSGALDKQKAAADGIEQALKGFARPVRFTHFVAPGLEHKQPPEWVAKCDAELSKHVPRPVTTAVRFVTHHTRHADAGPVRIDAFERQYTPAVVEYTASGPGRPRVRTTNVRRLEVPSGPAVIDGQDVPPAGTRPRVLERFNGRWQPAPDRLCKSAGRSGPIDDAFLDQFTVVGPTAPAWHQAVDKLAAATLARFAADWDRFLRGKLPTGGGGHRVLFGDPASNPEIAAALPKLPITWTKSELVVNGVRYDPATHLPVLIYPAGDGYVVLNSGHTFGEAEFRGSNALLFPRLGDWAVRKATGEVVASGLFDEDWRFTGK
jgi:hypothetical protein